MTEIADISGQFPAARKSERFYRSAGGRVVRVRTVRFSPDDLNAVHFQITAALCGEDGAPSTAESAPHLLVVKAESAVDVAAQIDAERRLVVARIEQGAIHRDTAAALAGVDDAD